MNQEIISNGSGARPSAQPRIVQLAEAAATSLKGAAQPIAKAGFTPEPPSFAAFAENLAELADSSAALRMELEQGGGQGSASVSGRAPARSSVSAAVPGVASWLGPSRQRWNGRPRILVGISHPDFARGPDAFVNGAGGVNSIVAAIGGSIPSPAQPWIILVAGFVAGALGLLHGLDHGSGVYVSMTWIAPGAFVPTSV